MTFAVSQQWRDSIGETHGIYNEIQVFDRFGMKLGPVPFTAGSVKDEWASGVRRSLTVTLIPTPSVRSWIQPGVELRAFSGLLYGGGTPEIVPMGCFPVTESSIGASASDEISLSCDDRWQWLALAPFPAPRASNVGMTVQQQVITLLSETGRWKASQVTNYVTSTAKMQPQVFEGDRHQTIIDLLSTIGAEVFIDRSGNPVIRYRPAPTLPVAAFVAKGRLKDVVVKQSSADVYNAVKATSTSSDPAVPSLTYTARLLDVSSPAYPPPGVQFRAYVLNSPQFTTIGQLKGAAQKMLSKVSRMARQMQVTAVATDPSLDASDTISVTLPDTGISETAQIQTVEHSLVMAGADSQQITTVSTRTDEDFTP